MNVPEWIKAGQTVTPSRYDEAEAAGVPMKWIWKGNTLNRQAVTETLAECVADVLLADEQDNDAEEKEGE